MDMYEFLFELYIFKVFGYLYCLFHFYFNCVILLFTTWLDLAISLKYFTYDFTILVKIFYDFS